MDRREEGFTLIELLVVIVIIGILAAIAIPTFMRQRNKGYRAQAIADVKAAAVIIETVASDYGGSYLTLDGATKDSPVLTADGYRSNVLTSLVVESSADRYCIVATHEHLAGVEFVYDSTRGLVDIASAGELDCDVE